MIFSMTTRLSYPRRMPTMKEASTQELRKMKILLTKSFKKLRRTQKSQLPMRNLTQRRRTRKDPNKVPLRRTKTRKKAMIRMKMAQMTHNKNKKLKKRRNLMNMKMKEPLVQLNDQIFNLENLSLYDSLISDSNLP
jgi:hypothetical protein